MSTEKNLGGGGKFKCALLYKTNDHDGKGRGAM